MRQRAARCGEKLRAEVPSVEQTSGGSLRCSDCGGLAVPDGFDNGARCRK